ncbi:MAG: hypothetical protein GQ474_01640 [Sulfurimonas sp.]|nr:hypothetical protein [Sulfurimonas sp.]
MAVNNTIKVDIAPKGTLTFTWVLLENTATQFKNVGVTAEIIYGTLLVYPTEQNGELINQGEVTDIGRGTVWVKQDAYFTYEFLVVS